MAMFTVSGTGRFPLSMLRFDEAWPCTDADANLIEASFEPDRRSGRYQVTLCTDKRFAPEVARWESFNWKVEAR